MLRGLACGRAALAVALAAAPAATADRLAAGGVRLAFVGRFQSPTFATAPPARRTGLEVAGITSFGKDGACRILVASKDIGRIFRLLPARRASRSGCQRRLTP